MSISGENKPKIVFRLGHLGDVALTTGVLSHWNEKRCETFIFITRKGNGAILANHPAIEKVIELEDSELKDGAWFARSRELAAMYKGYTLLDLHGTLRSRILSLVWKGTVKRYPKFGLTRRLFDLTHADRFRKPLEALNVPQRYYMAQDGKPPAAVNLVPRIHLTGEEHFAAQSQLEGITNSKPLVALHPYATHPAKQWPREHWRALTALLASEGIDWFVIGRDANPLFLEHERDLTNATDLRKTCAIISQASMLITGDSGPMHLACGVDTPVLALFGPTARSWGFYPAGANDHVMEMDMDCRPCSLHGSKSCSMGYECMAGIKPEEVVKTARNRLGL